MTKMQKGQELQKGPTTSQRLRGLLTGRGMTLDRLADRIGMHPRTMYNRLRHDNWSGKEIAKIRQALPDVNPDDLLAALITGYRRPKGPDLMSMTLQEIEELAAQTRYPTMTDADFEAMDEEFKEKTASDKERDLEREIISGKI